MTQHKTTNTEHCILLLQRWKSLYAP